MRLLHTSKFTLHEFFGNSIVRYAILSHRWENEEVTFQDLTSRRGPRMAGWSKVTGCCAQATLDGWEYVWIDTCCIDKTSSAELSKAINSMFGLYERAEVCYAYLADVPFATEDPSRSGSDFRRSKWFTRGWTLQELLAPSYVDFFDQSWNWIGSKAGLYDSIREITRVANLVNYKTASVAQKMSWASSRVPTRIEDEAYCLLGLFGVHMPPLYGEGENAFMRLQLEIINKTDDDCIFAWDAVGHHGLLAPSPSLFIGSSSVVRNIWDPLRPPHSMSSKGLCAHFPLIPNDESYVFNSHSSMDKNLEFVAPLNCKLSRLHGDINYKKVLALPIYHSISTEGTSKWNRNAKLQEFDVDSLGHRNLEGVNRKMIYVPHTPWGFSEDSIEEKTNFTRMQVKIDSLLVLGFTIKQCLMRELNAFWDCSDDPTLYPCENSFMESRSRASVTIENDNFQRVAIALGLSNGFLWVDIVILDMDEAMEQILDSVLLARKSLIGRDRISRPFLHGSLNARINKDSFADTVSRVVEVTFDPQGKLRWPVGKT